MCMASVACQQDTIVGEEGISNSLIYAVIDLSVKTQKVVEMRARGLPV